MSNCDPVDLERSAIVDRFMVLSARWCLDGNQLALLLGLPEPPDGPCDRAALMRGLLSPGRDVERRMRLLNEVDMLLPRLVPLPCAIPEWLRMPSVGYADDTVSPLVALSSGACAILALRNHLRDLRSGSPRCR